MPVLPRGATVASADPAVLVAPDAAVLPAVVAGELAEVVVSVAAVDGVVSGANVVSICNKYSHY